LRSGATGSAQHCLRLAGHSCKRGGLFIRSGVVGRLGGFGGRPWQQLRQWGIATPDWVDKLIQLEQVGGRAHEAKSNSAHDFVWRGGGDAYANRRGDAFSRDGFHQRCWQIEVLRRYRRYREGVLNLAAADCAAQCISACTPYVNANTNGAAQQKERKTSAVMRSIGR